jgi:hypothetical protein
VERVGLAAVLVGFVSLAQERVGLAGFVQLRLQGRGQQGCAIRLAGLLGFGGGGVVVGVCGIGVGVTSAAGWQAVRSRAKRTRSRVGFMAISFLV